MITATAIGVVFLSPGLLLLVFYWFFFWRTYPVCWLWRPRDDRARIARIIIELLRTGDWDGQSVHRSGLTLVDLRWDKRITLPGGRTLNLGGWYSRRIMVERKRAESRLAKQGIKEGQRRLAEWVLQDAAKVVSLDARRSAT